MRALRRELTLALALTLALTLTLTLTLALTRCVLCVEKPYLPGLIEVFEEEGRDDAPPPPFVLLA